jgi:hypothetical protein
MPLIGITRRGWSSYFPPVTAYGNLEMKDTHAEAK